MDSKQDGVTQLGSAEDLAFRNAKNSISSKRTGSLVMITILGFMLVLVWLSKGLVPEQYFMPIMIGLGVLFLVFATTAVLYKRKLTPYDAEDLSRSAEFFEKMNALKDSEEIKSLDESRFSRGAVQKTFQVKDVLIAREVVASYEKYDSIPPVGYIKLARVVLPNEK